MNNDTTKILIIAGTIRSNRLSYQAAEFIQKTAQNIDNVEVKLADPKDFSFPDEGEEGKDSKYTELTAWADAFYIVSPEYNHGYPSTLKRMLDSEFDNYIRKPVALAGVSNGLWGGVRMIENLLPVVRTLNMVPIAKDVQFPQIQNLFDDNGQLLDKNIEQKIGKALDELVWFAKALKQAK